MKKISKLLTLSLLALSITSCNTGKDNTSSSSSIVDSSSQTNENWKDEDISLIKKYCGEVLPYPTGLFVGKVTVTEVEDSTGSYLKIYDEADEFTLENYYESLETTGWKTITSFTGNKVQKNISSYKYVELTKNSSDNKAGYDLIYTFNEAKTSKTFDPDTNEYVDVLIPSCNIMQCYNDFTTTRTSNTTWSDEEISTIKYTITTTLPFFSLGSNSIVAADYSNSNVLYIYDLYTENLSKEYSDLLISNGFVLQKIFSEESNSYYLVKELADKSKIVASLYYLNGNFFTFTYIPKMTEYTSWPTDIISEIESKTGITVPAFDIVSGGSYSAYKKNDNVYYIQSITMEDTFDSWDYDSALNSAGLSQSISTWTYVNWEETISILPNNLVNSDYTFKGFEITIEITEPTSSFTSTWPAEKISNTLSSLLNITGITCPSLDDSLIAVADKQMKYETRGEDFYKDKYASYYLEISTTPGLYDLPSDLTEDEIKNYADKFAKNDMGFYMSIYDDNMQAYNAYESILYNKSWYKYTDRNGDFVYEDPTGKLAITISGYSSIDTGYGVTHILVHSGSGNTHTPEFYFEEEEYEVGIGKTQLVQATANMLPYTITYTSDTAGVTIDSTGKVTIDESVSENTIATITASITVPGEVNPRTTTCKVIAKKVHTYTFDSALDAVATLMNNKGYSITHTTGKKNMSINLGSSITKDNLKSLVTNSFIPEGFSFLGEEILWSDTTLMLEGDKEVQAQFIDYTCPKKDENEDNSLLEFFIYTDGDDLILYIAAY